MSDSDERIEKDLQELAAWLERLRHHVDFLRDRIGNDFPAEMIERTVPSSFGSTSSWPGCEKQRG